MVTSRIINSCGHVVDLKEGNGGVYRAISTIEIDGSYAVRIDTNATYREYMIVVRPSDEKVFVPSDDMIDNEIITVYVDSDGVFKFVGTPRGEHSVPKKKGSWLTRVFRSLWTGNSSLS